MPLFVDFWLPCGKKRRLAALGKTKADLVFRPQKQPWKLELAQQVRDETAAPYRWLAESLDFGRPETLRIYLCRQEGTLESTNNGLSSFLPP